MNPFLISGYKSPKYFCNREMETARLLNAIENVRNITLVSERRLGKTVLLKHLEKQVDPGIAFIYIDLYPTQGLNDFIQVLSNAILNKLEPFGEKVMKKVAGFFSFIKPRFSLDPQTGAPNLEFEISSRKEAEKTIGMLFSYIRESGKKAVIAFDEFQQIIQYPENNVESLLRTEIQKDTSNDYIFCGSQAHLLLSIFKESSRPFYQSTEILQLQKIAPSDYTPFITSHFSENNIKISEAVAGLVYEINNGITFNMQFLCNRLYSSGVKMITEHLVETTITEILTENEIVYYNYRELLSEVQYRVLTAIAHEKTVSKPLSSDFISKYKLKSASSVKSAIEVLLRKGFLTSQNGLYVSDVWFSLWLGRKL